MDEVETVLGFRFHTLFYVPRCMVCVKLVATIHMAMLEDRLLCKIASTCLISSLIICISCIMFLFVFAQPRSPSRPSSGPRVLPRGLAAHTSENGRSGYTVDDLEERRLSVGWSEEEHQ